MLVRKKYYINDSYWSFTVDAIETRKCVFFKPIFHLATLFAQREEKTIIRRRDWLKLAGEKSSREQVGTVPTFLSVRANKFGKWKIGFSSDHFERTS